MKYSRRGGQELLNYSSFVPLRAKRLKVYRFPSRGGLWGKCQPGYSSIQLSKKSDLCWISKFCFDFALLLVWFGLVCCVP